jgi:tetratricopeptide (TPR) repeat protein
MRLPGRVAAFVLAGLMLAGCSNPEQRAARYIQRGNELFAQGQFEKARIEYKNAARLKPTDPEVAYRMGTVEEAENNFRGAFLDYTHAEEQNAHFHPALLKLAQYYMVADQYEQAQKRIGIILTETPDDPDAHAVQGGILARQKDFTGAEKEARIALAKNPSDVLGFSVLAGIYLDQNESDRALATLEDGIAHNPKELSLMLLRAGIYEKAGDLPNTAKAYDAIFKIAPSEAGYRVKLADIYLRAGKVDEAEAALRAGIALDPNNWDLRRELVMFLGDRHGIDAAEKEIRSLMQSNPGKVELDEWLVDLYVSHDDIPRALAFINQRIADHGFDKQGLYARTALARIDYIQGNRDAAAKLAALVLENDPNNLDALFIKAHLESDDGEYQSAVSDLRSIIRDRPKAKEALRQLSETLMLQGHPDLAIDTLNQLADMDPLDRSVRVRLAQMYNANGDQQRAMDLLFLVTKEDPKYAVGWESTARVALDMKDWQTADTAIRTLDALEGQHMLATFLRAQLLTRTGKGQDAIADYTQVIAAEPNTILAQAAIAALVDDYHTLGRLPDAVHYLESLKSSDPFIEAALGGCYMNMGKNAQAAEAFDAAIAGHSPHAEPYLDRARLFLANRQPDQAIDILKQATAAMPGDIRPALMQGEIYSALGRYKEAVAIYDGLLTRDPELDIAANNLAEIVADYEYEDSGALEKARQVAERFVASANPLHLDTLAWIYYRQGNNQQAQVIMERAIATKAKLPPEVHYHYGAILVKADKPQAAKAELKQATVEGANYPGLDEARKLLAGL